MWPMFEYLGTNKKCHQQNNKNFLNFKNFPKWKWQEQTFCWLKSTIQKCKFMRNEINSMCGWEYFYFQHRNASSNIYNLLGGCICRYHFITFLIWSRPYMKEESFDNKLPKTLIHQIMESIQIFFPTLKLNFFI